MAFLRDHWLFVVLILGLFGAGITITAVAGPTRLRPYLVGAGVASAFWYLAMITVQFTGTERFLLGASGEEWTSDALRKLSRRGWHLIDHVPLRWGDIDHVLVGPGGAYAIETKATHGEWNPIEPDDRLRHAVEQARERAERLHFVLMSEDIKIRTVVQPVVVLWGTTTTAVAQLDGVQVMHGSQVRDWRRHLRDDVFTLEEVERAAAGLKKFVTMRDDRIEQDRGRLPSLVALGPSAILTRLVTGVLGATAALIVLGTAVPRFGDNFLAPLVALLLGAGVILRRVEPFRTFATGWLVVGSAVAAFLAGIYIAY
ncbi:MAG: NERD domain-containing protein [Actinomycetota bacterium]|nr:NERD domain-containing protein [Actinomycetota bacterium]